MNLTRVGPLLWVGGEVPTQLPQMKGRLPVCLDWCEQLEAHRTSTWSIQCFPRISVPF